MNTRYINELDAINSTIVSFNQCLNSSHLLPTFNSDTMMKDKNCVEIVHGDWDAFGFPNSAKRGVYFLLGYEKKALEKNGLYIGKASFGSAIGKRLYSHLHPHRSQSHFVMNGYRNETYVLDYMMSINLDACGLHFMAASLEEYLISDLKNKVNLINGTGN
jgi:hypothetical protein